MTPSEVPLPLAMFIAGLCLTSPHNIARVLEFGSLTVQGPLPSFYFPSELARGRQLPDRGDGTLSLPPESPGHPCQDVASTCSSNSLQSSSQLSLGPEPIPESPSPTPPAPKRPEDRTVSFTHKVFSQAGAEVEHTTVSATIVASETNESIVLGTFSPAFGPLLSDYEPAPSGDADLSLQDATPILQTPLEVEPGQDTSLLWPSLYYDASDEDFYEAEYIADRPLMFPAYYGTAPGFLDPGFNEPPLFAPPPPPRPLAIVPPPPPSNEPAVGPKKKRSRPRSVRKKKAAQSAAADAELNALDSVAGPVPPASADAAPEAISETLDNAHDTASQPANIQAEAEFIPEGTPLWLPARHDVSAEAIEWDEFGNAFLVAPLPPRPLAIINPSDGSLVEPPKLEKRPRLGYHANRQNLGVQLPKPGKCVLSRPDRTKRQDLETQPKKKRTRCRPRSVRKRREAQRAEEASAAAAASKSDTNDSTTVDAPPSPSPTVAATEASPAPVSSSTELVDPAPCATSPNASNEA